MDRGVVVGAEGPPTLLMLESMALLHAGASCWASRADPPDREASLLEAALGIACASSGIGNADSEVPPRDLNSMYRSCA